MSHDPTRPVIRRRPAAEVAERDAALEAKRVAEEARDQAPEQGLKLPEPPPMVEKLPSTPEVPEVKRDASKEEQMSGELPSTDDFAAMFGETDFHFNEVYPGDRVEATIVSIDSSNVFVDLGAKSEGVIDKNDLIDKDGTLPYAIGDKVKVYVVDTRGGSIRLSTVLRAADAGVSILVEAHAQQVPVEGKVVGINKGGFDIEIAGQRAFCPMSQISASPVDDPNVHLGQTYTFLVTRADESARNVVVSARALAEAERRASAEKLLETLKVGDVVPGTISRVADFGAFVDIGGMDGLVHVSELSWTRYDDPREFVQEGQTVTVKVLSMEASDRREGELRIALSMKELEEDPFVSAVQSVQIGDTIGGKVTRLMDFGAFVEIQPGLEGLVHISELVAGRRVRHPSEVVNVGDAVEVQVLNIDPQKRQIALSMRRLMDDPWAQAAVQTPPGTEVQGTVDALESFGAFITLENGLRALLPWSQLAEGEDRNNRKLFAVGEAIAATVLDIDVERSRMSLTRRDDTEAREDASAVRAQLRKQADAGDGFGTFADLFKNRKS